MKKKSVVMLITIFLVILAVVGLVLVLKNNRNQNENEVIKEYDITQFETFIDKSRYIPVLNNGKYGFINENGIEKIPCEYDMVSVFSKVTIKQNDYQVALVQKDGKYGFITKNNQTMFFDEAMNNELNELYAQITNTTDSNWKISNFSAIVMFIFEATNYDYDMERVSNTRNEQLKIDLEKDKNNNYLYNNSNYIMEIDENDKDNETYNWDGYLPTNVTIIKDGERSTNFEYIPYHDEYKSSITLYDDGYIPFCNLEQSVQGWYDKTGNRITVTGKFEILNVRNNIIILKNYDGTNNMSKIIFLDFNNNILLQTDEVEILDDGYLIKKDNDKIIAISNDLKAISKEYDKIIYSIQLDMVDELSSFGLYYSEIYGEKFNF